jgi:hypothetical protein
MGRKAQQRALNDLKVRSNARDGKSTINLHSFSCDRRQSRAARSILFEKLTVWSKQHARELHSKASLTYDKDKNDDWELVNNLVSLYPSQSQSQCILLPDRDILRQQELKAERIPSITNRASFAPGESRKVKREGWYRCTMCGKVFVTRYYLDLHMDMHHSDVTSGDVCPGDAWCSFLSPQACHDRALLDEPYYGRGSEGLREDRAGMSRYYSRMSYRSACDESEMENVREQCYERLAECFGESPIQAYLNSTLCSTISCHSRLQNLWTATVASTVDWHDHWQYWNEYHYREWLLFVVLLLPLSLCIVYWWNYHEDGAWHNKSKGTRLLRVNTPRKSGMMAVRSRKDKES